MLELLTPTQTDDAEKETAPGGAGGLSGSITPADTPHCLVFPVRPRNLLLALFAVIAVLAAASTAAHAFLGLTAENEVGALREVAMRFDMDRENTLPEWFSSLMLVACALLLGRIGTEHYRAGQRFACHWLFLSLAFVYLSIDESVGLHEILMVPLRRELSASGIFFFAWVLVALPIVSALFVVYLPFLWNLKAKTRWQFVCAGCLYVGGALGMEMVGGALVESSGYFTAQYTLAMTIEESCEMLGAAIFLCSLIAYLQSAAAPDGQTPTQVAPAVS